MSKQIVQTKSGTTKKTRVATKITPIIKKRTDLTECSKESPVKFSLESLVKKKAVKKIADEFEKPEKSTEIDHKSLLYKDYSEVLDKITKQEAMTLKEMNLLHDQIKNLDQEAHIEICRILIDEIGIESLTVNNYGTYIDLVDLPDNVLWRISYYVKLCQDDLERRKIKMEAQKQWQDDIQSNQQYQQMKQNGSGSHPNIFHQITPNYTPDKLPNYQDLRQDALRNLINNGHTMISNYDLNNDFVDGNDLNDELITETDDLNTELDEDNFGVDDKSDLDD